MLKDRFCVLRHQVLDPPLCLGNTIVQRHYAHSDISTKHHLHPLSPVRLLCLKYIHFKHRNIVQYVSKYLTTHATVRSSRNYIMKVIKIKQRRLNINMKIKHFLPIWRRAFSLCSVLCTLLKAPKQNLFPPLGST